MQTVVRFRDLPGIRDLESDAMIANKFHHGMRKDDVDTVSLSIFGITADQVCYEPPRWFLDGFESEEAWESAPLFGVCKMGPYFGSDYFDEFEEGSPREAVFNAIDEFEQQLCMGREFKDDYDRMEFAATLGVDFSDHTGLHPLHLTPYFFRQAVAAALGLKGHMPDLSELNLKAVETSLAEEARRFVKSRKMASTKCRQ